MGLAVRVDGPRGPMAGPGPVPLGLLADEAGLDELGHILQDCRPVIRRQDLVLAHRQATVGTHHRVAMGHPDDLLVDGLGRK